MNNSSQPNTLQASLNRYQTALNCLNASDDSLNKNEILKIISARDTLEKVLATEKEIPTKIFSELIALDAKFKTQAYRIKEEEIDLTEYSQSLPVNSRTWLLAIAKSQKSHPWSRYEWCLQGAKILIWALNIGLFTTLATRFLSGGSGFLELALIAFPGVLSLLQTQKELTKNEKQWFYKILQKVRGFHNINSRLRKNIVIFFSSIISFCLFPFSSYKLFLLFLLLVWSVQPSISEFYKKQGKINQNNQNLLVAEQQYLKAIAFNSDNFDAHYKLATLYAELRDVERAKKQFFIAAKGGTLNAHYELAILYENLQDIENAKKQYLIAVNSSHLPAYNNLAYWYIQQKNFIDAIALLDKSWDLVAEKEQPKSFQSLTKEEKIEFRVLKYNIAKNLSWAFLEAEQLEESEDWLFAAISFLANNPELKLYVANSGAAHCLYAKLQEKKAPNSPEIKQEWQKCKNLIQKRLAKEQINTEEYQWLYEAKKKLRN